QSCDVSPMSARCFSSRPRICTPDRGILSGAPRMITRMATDFVVRGAAGGDTGRDEFEALYGDDFASYEVRGSVRPGGVRGEGEQVLLGGDPDDIIEVTDADGLVWFQRAGSLAT